jgi:hypothetical protein
MKTEYIYEVHTETSGNVPAIGYANEQIRNQIIAVCIDKLCPPTLAEVLTSPLEDLRCGDESADDLLKKAVENWIGSKCLDALAADKIFSLAPERYFESLSVCVTLADNWKEWLR